MPSGKHKIKSANLIKMITLTLCVFLFFRHHRKLFIFERLWKRVELEHWHVFYAALNFIFSSHICLVSILQRWNISRQSVKCHVMSCHMISFKLLHSWMNMYWRTQIPQELGIQNSVNFFNFLLLTSLSIRSNISEYSIDAL